MKIASIVAVSTIITSSIYAQNGVIRGVVKDKKSGMPVSEATITIENNNSQTITDSNGIFILKNINPNSYNLAIQAKGYESQYLYNIVVTTGNEQILNIELDPEIKKDLKEVTILSNPFKRNAETPLSVQSLSAQEIRSNPGGNFDISRVIQAFPGVGGTSGSVGGYRNDLIIRGGAPNENVYYLDGIEVPVINHFATQGSAGGPTGIINTSFIQDVNLYTGAFPAKYDNVLSGILQLKQRDANPNKIQHNVRLSATEVAYSADGPITNKISFLASARRSYLQLLFKALQIPIQPSYWDFQYKINYKINNKLTFYTLAIGAIDNFSFITPDNLTAENVYTIRSTPLINQWSYTNGYGLKKLVKNGFWNITFSRNMLNNQLDKYTDNQNPSEINRTLKIRSTEAENKLRWDINKYKGEWNYSFGAMTQYEQFSNTYYQKYRNATSDSNGNILSPATIFNSKAEINFLRYGLYGQISRNFFDRKLSVSFGLRTDGNTYMNDGNDILKQLSPRLSASYSVNENLRINFSTGRYYKIPTYTLLGYKDTNNNYVNKSVKYIGCDHLTAGVEFQPNIRGMRITLEGFYKSYFNYPTSVLDNVSLANKGGDFSVLGNESVASTGKGRSYGLEFQFQQKLTKNVFAVLSYTYFLSEFTNLNGKYIPASWDNRHLLSFIGGYKFKRNIELGVKFRYQGSAPYTPYDMVLSRANYNITGTGILDYTKFNTLRLSSFNAMDIRIDKKWNFKRSSFDLYFDLTNAYKSIQPSVPNYTFKRTADNKDFATTDGQPLKADGSNGIPILLEDNAGTAIPTIGFIYEF